jgi:hypothetical protein
VFADVVHLDLVAWRSRLPAETLLSSRSYFARSPGIFVETRITMGHYLSPGTISRLLELRVLESLN